MKFSNVLRGVALTLLASFLLYGKQEVWYKGMRPEREMPTWMATRNVGYEN